MRDSVKENKHTKEELARLIALPLEDKIALTKLRITEFYERLLGGYIYLLVVEKTALYY